MQSDAAKAAPLMRGVICATCYTISMIKSFKHKGLEKFYESGSTKGIQANHAKKLRMQLVALDTAQSIDDMDIPGYRLHQLTGDRRGIWTITVNANWRLTFEFEEGNVFILNYEDYH
jgi:proteic killer suppression protein